MMKLEPKHLIPYLPYGLNIKYRDCTTNRYKKARLSGITETEIETTHRKRNGIKGDLISWTFHNNIEVLDVKPILRPLSDMNKLIKHNGRQFTPIECLNHLTEYLEIDTDFCGTILDWREVQEDIDFLLSCHFDLYGLIDAKLAIDINTVAP